MDGSRITSEDKATLSTYIGVGIGTVLCVGAIYFFFLAKEKSKGGHRFRSEPAPAGALQISV